MISDQISDEALWAASQPVAQPCTGAGRCPQLSPLYHISQSRVVVQAIHYVVDPPAKHVDCWLTFPPSFAFSAPDLRDFIMAGFKIWVFGPETQEGFVLTCAVCDQALYPAGSVG